MLSSAFGDGIYVPVVDSPSDSSSENDTSPYRGFADAIVAPSDRQRRHADPSSSNHTRFTLTADGGSSSPELRFKKEESRERADSISGGSGMYSQQPHGGMSFRKMSGALHRRPSVGAHLHHHHQDDTALRSRIADLEFSVAKAESRLEENKTLEREMESIQLESTVAQRNCEIQRSNVDTLKALCVQLAEQLEEANIRIRTSEEKLNCKALREELTAAGSIDAMRLEYEGRMNVLRGELKKSTSVIEASSLKWSDRELEQDERIRRLEKEKDETILKLLRENAMLKKVLNSSTDQQQHAQVSGNTKQRDWASGIVSTPNRRIAPVPPTINVAACIQETINKESNEQSNNLSAVRQHPPHPDLSNVGNPTEILTFSLQQRDVVPYHSLLVSPRRRLEAMGGSRWPRTSPVLRQEGAGLHGYHNVEDDSVALGSSPIRGRGILGVSQPFASSAAAEAARYHVEVGVNEDELETVDSSYFQELSGMRGAAEVQRRVWSFRTKERRAVRLTLESL